MSLLHKALKKAEKEGKEILEEGVFVDTEEPPRSTSLRTYLLVGLALASLLFVIAVRVLKKSPAVAPSPREFTTPLQIGGGPGAAEITRKALELMEAGKFDEARSHWEKVVILEPRNAEAYNNLGLALKKLGRSEEAFEQYRKALSIEPDCVECLNNLGVLYLGNRDLAEAENHFRKALERRPDYADPTLHLAILLEARGDLEGARKHYLKYIDLAKGIDAAFLLKIQQRIASLETP